MSLNPFALEWYPSPSSSPEGTSFIQQIAALDNLSLDDFYETDVTPAQLEELEATERWTQQQAMLAEMDEQQEQLQMVS
jgi:hypothetical protein